MFKNAKWIGLSKNTTDESIMLRKVFSLKSNVKSAVLHCIGLGQAVYHINGQSVTDCVYVTHFTKYDSRVLSNRFDVTALLREGKNVIAVHLGNGLYNDENPQWNRSTASWRAGAKLLLSLELEYTDGTDERIVSDTSWFASFGPLTYNHTQSGEIYDFNLLPADWDGIDCDESAWKPAVLCAAPGGRIDYMEMPLPRVIRTIRPTPLENGIYDCGEGISGRARIRFTAQKDSGITIRYAERLQDDGTLCLSMNMYLRKTRQQNVNHVIADGRGEREYAPDFTYHGFRYLQIEGDFDSISLVCEVIHNDFDIIGEFSCSDEMLNEIHKATRRSTLTNYMDVPTDCPTREQNGWTGDALISCEQSLLNYDMKAAYRKWLYDFKDAQRPSGQLPGIIPTSGWGYNWGSGPAWDSALIMIPWHVYQNTGDSSLIKEMYENMALYMTYMCSMAEDHIVDYGLGDWKPPRYKIDCPTAVTDTGFFYANARIMSKCARLLGKEDPYAPLAEQIKAAYRKRFLSNTALASSQTFLANGIYRDLYTPEEKRVAAEALAKLVIDNGYHIDCGILGAKYIFTALSECGYADVAYRMVTNPTPPSYAYWILCGHKNLCEQWLYVDENGVYESLNHHMYSEVDNWLYKYVAGIHLDENGLLIKPCFIKGLDRVSARHRGISVSFDADALTLETDRKTRVELENKVYEVESGSHTFPLKR